MSGEVYSPIGPRARSEKSAISEGTSTDGRVHCWVNCNDLFWWATADCEEITPETLPTLMKCYEDCKAADPIAGVVYADTLFACRMRKMRPQGACYKSWKDAPWLIALLDACGPPREADKEMFGNPMSQDAALKPGTR